MDLCKMTDFTADEFIAHYIQCQRENMEKSATIAELRARIQVLREHFDARDALDAMEDKHDGMDGCKNTCND